MGDKKVHESEQKDETKHNGMAKRGAARPTMKGDHEQGMDREKMLHHHHHQTLWVYWAIIMLGVWMVLSPFTFSYGQSLVTPSGMREVWISLDMRIQVLKWSDMISGVLLMVFGWRSLTPNRPVSLWVCAFVGIWLSFAPVIFWAPSAMIYLNETIVGVLIIALTILIPGMPNMIMYMKMGSEVPPGWSYNPSSWPQRWIMIVTGFIGWFVSRYLAAFQMGFIENSWDPFFGHGAESVLNSSMSHSLPVSDGALGALAYTFEFLMGWMGSPSRWRTMPWMVTFFGILVIPLGLVHIFLVISQPLAVGEWCTFCLLAAAIMLPMIPLEIDEVVAMGQHMVQARRKGESFWKVFWKGGEPMEKNRDERSPELMKLPAEPGKVFKASIWGMSFPRTLNLAVLIGLYLMFAPGFFGVPVKNILADINHLCGALIVVVSVISMGEVVRRLRYVNVLLGLAVAVGVWFVGEGEMVFKLLNVLAGLAVIILSIPRGIVKEKYGLWDKYVR